MERLFFVLIFVCSLGEGFAVLGLGQVEEDTSQKVAGSERVAEIIKTYGGRGTLSDGSDPTPPKDAVEKFKIRDGFEIELVAGEPVIGQPLHISWDSKGRMWVTQYQQYQFPAGLRIVEYDNHLRAQFDKVPLPPPHGTPGADKITVFEDTNGDGIYDHHQDVITGLNIATSCVTGAGGIWVANPPYLLYYPDADGDTLPDEDPEVKLSGFGIEDTHSVMNSLKWGPDGWLYGVNGSTTTGKVRDPASGDLLEWQGQMVWRYHPTSEKFEIYAEGGGNTFSLDIDSQGRVFSGTNNGRTRGMYYPQGAYGKKGWGKHGPLTNPYAFGYINHMRHEGDERRFAQAFCIYEGGIFGNNWEGKIIAPNSLHNIVWVSDLLQDGSTFRTVDEEPLVTTEDRWFRPVFSGVGPDGCIYIADWYDTRLSHVRPIDDWHKESGRIYRVKPKGSSPCYSGEDLAKMGQSARMKMFLDSGNWMIRKRILLEEEWNPNPVVSLPEGALDEDPDMLNLWFEGNGGSQKKLRILGGEIMQEKGALLNHLRVHNLLGSESPETVALIASLAKRVSHEEGIEIVSKLFSLDEFFSDPHIPLLVWWALEAHAETGRAQIETLAAQREVWGTKIYREFVAERLMRRYAMAGGEANLETCAKLLESAPDADAKRRYMTGLQLAFQGAPLPGLPDSLSQQMDAFTQEQGESELLLSLQRGETDGIDQAIVAVTHAETDPVERIALVRELGNANVKKAIPALLKVLGWDQESTLKKVALLALAKFEDPAIPRTIISRHGSTLPAEHGVRATAHRVLAGRTEWALQMLEQVDKAVIKARNVAPDVVLLLLEHGDSDIDEKVSEHWPGIAVGSGGLDLAAESSRIKNILAEAKGDADSGQGIFAARCAVCHQLFGEGKLVGPDLTGYERHNLEFWIPALVNPSLEIREEYLNFVASMKDGRKLSGIVSEQSPASVSLLDLAGQVTHIQRTEMDTLVASPVSVMPPNLLAGLSNEELQDLFAYLMKSTH